jgi:hypothetical protein
VYFAVTVNQTVQLQLLNSTGLQVPYTAVGLGYGTSIKLATSEDLAGPLSQFEFTWSGSKVYWDFSNINGDGNSSVSYPFYQGGVSVIPSEINDPYNPTCTPIICPAMVLVCSEAYNAPNDNRTLVCDQNSDLTLTLCPSTISQARRSVRLPLYQHQTFPSHQNQGLP